jgi:hypothetical protein
MKVADKRRFVRNYMKSVQADVLKAVAAMPDEWDGHELRRFIADKFAREGLSLREPSSRSRLRDYRIVCYDRLGLAGW